MNRFTPILLIVVAGLAACSDSTPEPAAISTDERVNAIATEFVDGYYNHYPELVYEIGYIGAPMDRWGDHSVEAQTEWKKQVYSWLNELQSIDPKSIESPEALRTWQFAGQKMEAIVGLSVCAMESWNVSPTWTSWQYMFASTLAVQPAGTDQEKADALARLEDIARYLYTEIDNLKIGQSTGYAAGQNNVDAVVEQVTSLIETPATLSPFFGPAGNSNDLEFATDYVNVLIGPVTEAMVAYRDYLRDEYHGHEGPGVRANPNGADCYDASVIYHSSVAMDAETIHRTGLAQMARIQSEMLEIAESSFGTSDVKGLLETLRTDPKYTFRDEQHMLDYIAAAVDRGEAAMGDWFGNVPDAEMIIVAAPAYEKDSGGGFYSGGAADGSRPGIYTVGTYNPTTISQAGQEATAFHESYPGHHLQNAIAMSNESAHPIFRFMYVSGSAEGWGLYSERVADEAGLYSDDVARLGMLSNEAYRAARLVVDPGIHVMGWSREEAIQYMLDHTAESYNGAASEIDRYSAVPGQATSYMIGSLEIQRLRQKAEQQLGDDFDIREFHDRLLEHGGVTLPMLSANVEEWLASQSGE